MNIRTILVGAAVLALGGYAWYDYNGPDSRLARELKEIEQLEPDVRPPECFPKGQNAKLFAVGIQRDKRPKAEMANEVARRSAITHDCIRGNEPRTVQRVAKALGTAGVPVYALDYGACLAERVRHGENGLLFSTARQLADVLFDLFETFPANQTLLERLRAGARKSARPTWEEGWEREARSVLLPGR